MASNDVNACFGLVSRHLGSKLYPDKEEIVSFSNFVINKLNDIDTLEIETVDFEGYMA
jgi:hypothetical protein